MEQVEKLRTILSDDSQETHTQGLSLFESLDFDSQLKVGFEYVYASKYPNVKKTGMEIVNGLSEQDKATCFEQMFNAIPILDDGTLDAKVGWVWTTELLEGFLKNRGHEIKGLRLSTIPRAQDGFGDFGILSEYCPHLTHIDLCTVELKEDAVTNLKKHPHLIHFELALTGVSDAEIASWRKEHPNVTILTTEDKIGKVFQYNADDRGIRVAAVIYPRFKNGKLFGALASGIGYSGGGCQSEWTGAAVFRDDFIQWEWGYFGDPPENSTQTPYNSAKTCKHSEFGGYLVSYEELDGDLISSWSCIYEYLYNNFVKYDEEEDWIELNEDIKSIVLEKGGFWNSSAYCSPSLFFAGACGPLNTYWPGNNIDFALAREMIAPRLPTFTKYGEVPTYRFVIYHTVNSEVIDPDITKTYEEAYAESVQKYRSQFESVGLQFVKTLTDEHQEGMYWLMTSPKSMIELNEILLELSGREDIGFRVSDLDSLTQQYYDYGDYDTGTIGLMSSDLQVYKDDALRLLELYQQYF